MNGPIISYRLSVSGERDAPINRPPNRHLETMCLPALRFPALLFFPRRRFSTIHVSIGYGIKCLVILTNKTWLTALIPEVFLLHPATDGWTRFVSSQIGRFFSIQSDHIKFTVAYNRELYIYLKSYEANIYRISVKHCRLDYACNRMLVS